MPASHFILMIESDAKRSERLATQLVRLGVEPIRVADLDEAVELVKSGHYVFGALLLPADLPGKLVHKALKSMRRHEPLLPAMVYGKVPDHAQRSALRRAGVTLALWDGYDETLLRFQTNRLVSGDGRSTARESRRVPVRLPVRVVVGGREKVGTIQSLSQGGCFIETPRASMDGARLRLLFTIEDQAFEIDGIVAFANVPGNLQRPNLPLGMGVRWKDASPGDRTTIARIVQERAAALEL